MEIEVEGKNGTVEVGKSDWKKERHGNHVTPAEPSEVILPMEVWHRLFSVSRVSPDCLPKLARTCKRLHEVVSNLPDLHLMCNTLIWPLAHLKHLVSSPRTLSVQNYISGYAPSLMARFGNIDRTHFAWMTVFPIQSNAMTSEYEANSLVNRRTKERLLRTCPRIPAAPVLRLESSGGQVVEWQWNYCVRYSEWQLTEWALDEESMSQWTTVRNDFQSGSHDLAIDTHFKKLAWLRELSGIPSTLTSLDICHYEGITTEMLPPNLTRASIPRSQFGSLLGTPRSLTFLEIATMSSTLGSPPNLRTLILDHSNEHLSFGMRWLPTSLQTLHVGLSSPKEGLGLIPRSVTDLVIFMDEMDPVSLAYLPRGLQSLRVSFGAHDARNLQLLLPTIPQELKTLSINTLSDDMVPKLPRALTRLFVSWPSVTAASFDYLPEALKASPCSISRAYLPIEVHQKLESLAQSTHPASMYDFIWSNPLIRQMAAKSCRLLPRDLVKLHVDGKGWMGDDLSGLPPQLEDLCLCCCNCLSSDDVSLLPGNLTTLILPCQVASYPLIANLPRSLKTLVLGVAVKIRVPVFACSPLEKPCCDSYEPSKAEPEPRLSDPNHESRSQLSLPDSLTALDITFPFTEEDLKKLPGSLLDLRMDHLSLYDSLLALLPRSLTSLSLPMDAFITDNGIENLPRDLSTLYLGGNSHISDEGVLLLPPHLTSLYLPCNTAMTDACVPWLPRSLTCISLTYNRNFHIESLELWPQNLSFAEIHFQEPAVTPKVYPSPFLDETTILDEDVYGYYNQ